MINHDKALPTTEAIRNEKEAVLKSSQQHQNEMQKQCEKLVGEKVNMAYQICYWEYANSTQTFYTTLDVQLGIPSGKSSELIKAKLDDLTAQAANLAELFKTTTASIKDTKDKFTEAFDLACKMNRCIEAEKRCNPDIYKVLEENIPDIWDRMIGAEHSFRMESKHIYDHMNQTFDGAIKTSGFLTFIDYSNLVPTQELLAEDINNLIADIDDNLTYAGEQKGTASDGFQSAFEEVMQTNYDKCVEGTQYLGLEKTYNNLSEPQPGNFPDADSFNQLCLWLSQPCAEPEDGFEENNMDLDDFAIDPNDAEEQPTPEVAPNDIIVINGIGQGYKEALNQVGIFTIDQLAQMSEEEIREKLVEAGKTIIPTNLESWIEQAKEMLNN